MKLASVEIENYRAIEHLVLEPDPALTVLFGINGCGKTSVLTSIALALGTIQNFFWPKEKRVGFLRTDRRAGAGPMRVATTTTDGMSWQREEIGRQFARVSEKKHGPGERLGGLLVATGLMFEEDHPRDLPIGAYYDTDRIVLDVPQRRRGFDKEFHRTDAWHGALSARTDFRHFFQWFYAKENEELRALRKLAVEGAEVKHDDASRELRAVRAAISSMVGGVDDPRIEANPLRFVVTVEQGSGRLEDLAIDQLSGGCRAVLTLAADLARRMAQGNPHLEDPLKSEAVVLIDEIELHLHPEWQQRILGDLRRTFPNAQFIVSTHSPQVLTTVAPEHIRELVVESGRVTIREPSAHTFGAEAGDVLDAVMGVDERPPRNEFVEVLNRYTRLVDDGDGESPDALTLRAELERLSPTDPALHEADLEIRRQKALASMADSS